MWRAGRNCSPVEVSSIRSRRRSVMIRIKAINHVTLIVDDLEKARQFYTHVLGLEELPAYAFDYPAQFYRINDTQQLHITEWKDSPSFRGHVCLQVADFSETFL